LPSLKPRDADLTWQVISQQPRVLVEPGEADGTVSADGTATMHWKTTVEPPDVASGREQYDGVVRVRATVHRTDLGKFTDTLLRLFLGFLPSALPQLVKDTIAGLLRPKILQAIDGLSSIRDLSVLGNLFPIYHEKEETPTPSPSPSPAGEGFCQGFVKMLEYRESQSTGGLDKRVAAQQVKMLRDILPLGTAQQRHDGGILATIWQMWVEMDPTSADHNPGVIGQAMVELGYDDAARRIAKSCKISRDRIGVG
jgi:hypothetical protein